MNDQISESAGYVYNFDGHGAFSPEGRVGTTTESVIQEHNRKLSERTLAQLKEGDCGLLYIFGAGIRQGAQGRVGTWDGTYKFPITRQRFSFHNMAGREGRIDLWFNFDGSIWHGVNIGDSEIVHCRRTKRTAPNSATKS